MAQKPGELNSLDRIDPVAGAAGAGTDPFVEKYVDSYPETESREMEASTGEHPEQTEHIRSQIEETRKEMGETIDAIQERLSFANVSEQVSEQVSNVIESAKDTLYQATIGKAVNFMRTTGDGIANSGVARTVKNNPFPLLLIGLGAGLLAYQSYSSNRYSANYSGRRRYLGGERGESDYGRNREMRDNQELGMREPTGAVGKSSERVYDKISNTAGGAYSSVAGAAGSAYESVSSAATGALETVSGTFESAYQGAGDTMHRVYNRAGEYGHLAQEKYDYMLEENPLALGAIALAVGAAVGMAIPATRYEGQLMGEARENLMQKATDAAGQLVERARHVADETGRTIKEEAQQALNQ